jgi:hypothetical protein
VVGSRVKLSTCAAKIRFILQEVGLRFVEKTAKSGTMNSKPPNGLLLRMQMRPQTSVDVRGYSLSLPGGAPAGVPEHFLAAAVREIHHVACCGGVVADFGRFVACLPRAYGVEEVR